MKKLLVLASVFALTSVSAQTVTRIKTGDTSLSRARASLVSVAPICPTPKPGEMTCMAIGSKVRIKVALQGCLDSMGGYFYRYERKNGKNVLYFGAINVANKQSIAAFCTAQPMELVDVYVEENINTIQLVELNFMGTAFTK